jgi:amino acid transporter
MGSKKKTKERDIKEKKKKVHKRRFFLSVMILVGIVFLVFFFVSLFDKIYPPISGKSAATREKEKKQVQLYFADANERFLVAEERYITKEKAMTDQARELVGALIEGPHTSLVRTLPEGVEIRDITVSKGTAYVDFSKKLRDLHPGGSASELTTIYSLTNTLAANIKGITRTKILMEGKELQTIKGHIDTRNPFPINRELIVKGHI